MRPEALRPGADLFDRGAWFEAHELWEAIWLRLSAPERAWVQGLIQLCAARIKLEAGVWSAADRLGNKAIGKLEGAPEAFAGVDISRARAVAASVVAAAARGERACDDAPLAR